MYLNYFLIDRIVSQLISLVILILHCNSSPLVNIPMGTILVADIICICHLGDFNKFGGFHIDTAGAHVGEMLG